MLRGALPAVVFVALGTVLLSAVLPGPVGAPTASPGPGPAAGEGPAVAAATGPGAALTAGPNGPNCSALAALYASLYSATPAPSALRPGVAAPCVAGQDGFQASFESNATGSAARVEIAIDLPPAASGSARAVRELWAGLWLGGVPCSLDGATYLSVDLLPPYGGPLASTNANWTVAAPAWDLVPAGACDPQCQNTSAAFTIAGVGYCEDDAAISGPGALGSAGGGAYAPGDALTLTFLGEGTTSGLRVYLNDTTHPADSESWNYSSTVSVSHQALHPLFDRADASATAWGAAQGVSVGFDSCPGPAAFPGLPACDSYDGPLVNASGAPTIRSVRAFNATAQSYTVAYDSVRTSSSTGACDPAAPIACTDFSEGSGTANYPYLAVHAAGGESWLSLGGAYPQQLSDLGGSPGQFAADGTASGPQALSAFGPVESTVSSSGVNLTLTVADPRGVAAVQADALFCFGSSTASAMTVAASLASGPYDSAFDGNWTAHFPASNDSGTFGFALRARSSSGSWSSYLFGNRTLSGGGTGCTVGAAGAPGFSSANVSATAGGFSLYWSESGPGVLRYRVSAIPAGGGPSTSVDAGALTELRISGLEPNRAYTLSVRAVNLANASTNSSAVTASATLAALNATLDASTSVAWVGGANVTYTAGATGGTPPYTYVLGFGDGTSVTVTTNASSVSIAHNFSGFYGGADVRFGLSDAQGSHAALSPEVLTQVWATPLGVPATIAASDGLVALQWNAPASPGGAVTGYTVYATENASSAGRLTGAWPVNRTGSEDILLFNTSALGLTLDVPDGTTLYAQVLAWNSFGEGLLPGGSPVLRATAAPLSAGPIATGPGGPAPYNGSYSTVVGTGTNDNLTQAIYVFPGGAVVPGNVSGANGTLWVNASYTLVKAGTWLVLLHLTDDFDIVAIVTALIYVGPGLGPSVGIAAAPGAHWVGSPVDFSASLPATGGPYTISWSFGDGGNGTGPSPQHSYDAPGSYTVSATVFDNETAGLSQRAILVEIYALPAVAIATTAGPGGAGSFEFTAVLSGGNGSATVVWSLGDGTVDSGTSVVHSYSGSGRFTVNVTATFSGGRTASSEVDVYVAGVTAAATGTSDTTLEIVAAALSVAVVVLAGLTVFLYWRGRRAASPEEPGARPR